MYNFPTGETRSPPIYAGGGSGGGNGFMDHLFNRAGPGGFGGFHPGGGPSQTPHPTPSPIPAVPPVVPPVATPGPYPAPNPTAPPAVNPTSALDTYANSAGLNFILNQGQKAISGQNAAGGTLQSGATGKALEQYGQGLGSQYLNTYMDKLFDYAKLGLGSASALSGAGGVGQSQGTSNNSSSGTSYGASSGYSQGNSASTAEGTGSSKGHQKNGLLPDLAAFPPIPA